MNYEPSKPKEDASNTEPQELLLRQVLHCPTSNVTDNEYCIKNDPYQNKYHYRWLTVDRIVSDFTKTPKIAQNTYQYIQGLEDMLHKHWKSDTTETARWFDFGSYIQSGNSDWF